MIYSITGSLRLVSLLACATSGLALNVPISLSAPSGAPKISPSLISLSIEQDRWTDWVGTTSRNQFFYNTLDNLKQLTGAPPHIRIGGNTEDHTGYSANVQFAQNVFPATSATTPYPEATNVTVGDSFYQTARFLPPNTHVTWGVDFGRNSIATAFQQTQSIIKAFSSSEFKDAGIVLDFLEIGNEPDLYKNNGLRPSSYTSTQYVKEWISFATNVSVTAGLSTSSTKILAASFAGSSHTTSGFSPQAIFNEGILTSAPGKFISTISEHRYSGSFCTGSGGLLQDLMTKSSIRGNLTTYSPDITATHAKGLDYILGETNSYACHGAPGVSNTAGAALWTLDYALFAPQIGITNVFFHAGIGFKYSLLQPITLTRSILDGSTLPKPLPPHVQPQYYAAIIAAEAIGSTGEVQAVELNISHSQVAGYAFYEGGALARAVLIQSKAFLQGNTNRATIHLDLLFSGSGTAPSSMRIKRLAIGHADDTSNLTWGGQSYETSDGKVGGSLNTVTAQISSGVDIHDTEVVLLDFN